VWDEEVRGGERRGSPFSPLSLPSRDPPVPPCVREFTYSPTYSLQPGEARIAGEREKGFNSNLVIFFRFFFPFPKRRVFFRSFPDIGLSRVDASSAPAAVITTGEGREGKGEGEGFTIQYQKRWYVSFVL